MVLLQFRAVVQTVEMIIARCGESAVLDIQDIHGRLNPAVFVTRFAFDKFTNGRTVHKTEYCGKPYLLYPMVGASLWCADCEVPVEIVESDAAAVCVVDV
jgi:hypothetical protein